MAPQTQPVPAPSTLQIAIAAIDDLLGLHLRARKVLKSKAAESPEEEKQILRFYEEGLQKTLDLISPASMEIRQNEIMLNEQHIHTLFTFNWPNFIFPNWLSPS